MKPKQNRIHSRQAVDLRSDSRLLGIQATYLKHLTLAFIAEVEALEANRLNFEHGLNLREEVRRFEIDLIRYALQRTGGIQTRAATLLGVNKTTLNAKIKLYHLQPKLIPRVAEDGSDSPNISTRPVPALAFRSVAEEQG